MYDFFQDFTDCIDGDASNKLMIFRCATTKFQLE
uniref:Protein binding protein n=1 Tax=Rhizophora mucronata TaxID=61149 RepID=A0A2P2M388_RHIMU